MAAQREWFEKDYYDVLGVPEGATDKELARAYKKLAKQLPPRREPRRQGRGGALQGGLRRVRRARRRRRSARSTTRSGAWSRPAPARGGFGPGGPRRFRCGRPDVPRSRPTATAASSTTSSAACSAARGGRRGAAAVARAAGPQRGQDLETELYLSFDDAVHGVTSTVRFRSDAVCSHLSRQRRGARHLARDVPAVPRRRDRSRSTRARSRSRRCARRAAGAARSSRRRARRATAAASRCATREVKVRVPAGVADGQRIRVKGRGGAGRERRSVRRPLRRRPRAAAPVVRSQRQRPDAARARHVRGSGARRRREGPDARRSGDRPDPAGDPERQGHPRPRQGHPERQRARSRATLLVTVDVQVPAELNDEQRSAVDALAEVFDPTIRAPRCSRRSVSTKETVE